MNWQTLTKHSLRDRTLPSDIIERILEYLKKEKYSLENPKIFEVRPKEKEEVADVFIQEIRNKGTIISYYNDSRIQKYNQINCNGYVEYHGFEDTLESKRIFLGIKKSLEECCYVHTEEDLIK